MPITMKTALEAFADLRGGAIRLPDVTLDPATIMAVMINEVVPADPAHDFYGSTASADYLKTTIPMFEKAGARVRGFSDILDMGIYITNTVKEPKTSYTIGPEVLDAYIPVLEKELSLFPNLKVVMLMGDVAKKAYNKIVKKETGKNVIPSGATYRLRKNKFYNGTIRVFPSYIMTGGNILIEKSKAEMAAEDIRQMLDIIS